MYQIPKLTLRKVRLGSYDGNLTLLHHKEKLNKNGAYTFSVSWLGNPEDDMKYNLTLKYSGFNLLIPKWWRRLDKDDFTKHILTTNIQQTYMSEAPMAVDTPYKVIDASSITKGGVTKVFRNIRELDHQTFSDSFSGIHGMIETLSVLYNTLNTIAFNKKQYKADGMGEALVQAKRQEKLHTKSLVAARQRLYEQSYDMLFGH